MNIETQSYYGYCPFCSKPIIFNRKSGYKIKECPICGAPIYFEFSASNARIVPNFFGDVNIYNGLEVQNGLLVKYTGHDSEIIIPKEVTAIDKEVFKDNKFIKSVKFNKSVRFIGESAFENCAYLREIVLSENIVAIANCAFKNCRRLEKIAIPKSLIAAGFELFNGCDNILECIFPMDMNYLGGSPYTFCKNLKKVNIPHCVSDTSHWFCGMPNIEEIIIGENASRFPPLYLPRLTLATFSVKAGWKSMKNFFDPDEEEISESNFTTPKKAALTLKKLAKDGKTLFRPSDSMSFDYWLDLTK